PKTPNSSTENIPSTCTVETFIISYLLYYNASFKSKFSVKWIGASLALFRSFKDHFMLYSSQCNKFDYNFHLNLCQCFFLDTSKYQWGSFYILLFIILRLINFPSSIINMIKVIFILLGYFSQ